jgi:hypothetical protein
MHHAIAAFVDAGLVATAATPTPTPTPPVNPELVTPGTVGFIATAFVAIAVILLVWDMMRRIRRGRVRADIREELDAEEQAARAMEATDTDDDSVDAAGDDTARDDDAPADSGGDAPRPPRG